MCELMTVAAALAATALYVRRRKSPALLTTTLMLWGAAIMWSMDCIHSALEGEGFFDLSGQDARLGLLVLAASAAVWGLLEWRDRGRRAAAR